MKEGKLKDFFNPETIAIIGASEDKTKVGGILLEKAKKSRAKIIPINPKHKILQNIQSYSSISQTSEKIDLVVIAIPAKFILKTIDDCHKKKIKNIIIISAGFAEEKNFKLQEELTKKIDKYKINLLGPNCFGIFNPKLNLDLTFAKTTPKKGNIAFISQSGALWSYISDLNKKFSGFISLGNMSDLDFSDWIEYFNKDKSTKKIILYIEKLKEGKRFIKICKKSKKEIIVIKAGKSEQGKQATISHTASIATDYKIYKGAFKQAKIKQVKSLQEAFNLKSQKISLNHKETTIITNAGGAGALLTDTLIQQEQKIIGPKDILGTAKETDYKRELSKLEKKNYQGNIGIILTPQTMSNPKKTAEIISQSKLKKNIIAFFLGKKSIKQAVKVLNKNKIKTITKI
ncbi:hypothetical protein HOD88_00095 [archaeon]|jgi:acyl-CoA synthetase (NDP forming)|nr:hypothetical protein [archaeon]